jgi:ElaB/YqjD/DUF883 family membrane-anchored ribosome-binding protein
MSLVVQDVVQNVCNRSAQIPHDVHELGSDLRDLESTFEDLAISAKTWRPQSQADGLRTRDRNANKDPRDELAAIRGRLRAALRELDQAISELPKHRAAIAKLIAD